MHSLYMTYPQRRSVFLAMMAFTIMFAVGMTIGMQSGLGTILDNINMTRVQEPPSLHVAPHALTSRTGDETNKIIEEAATTPNTVEERTEPNPNEAILEIITEHLAKYRVQNPWKVANQVLLAGRTYKVDPLLVLAVGTIESNWRMDAVSSKGAIGPMQIVPDTFYNELGGKNIWDWQENVMLGAKYLAQMIQRAGGDLVLALGYYNAGPSRPDALIRRITREYAHNVITLYKSLVGELDEAFYFSRR